jgi:hypothetical protein
VKVKNISFGFRQQLILLSFVALPCPNVRKKGIKITSSKRQSTFSTKQENQ